MLLPSSRGSESVLVWRPPHLFDVRHYCSHLFLCLLQVWLVNQPAQLEQLVQQQPVLLLPPLVIGRNPDEFRHLHNSSGWCVCVCVMWVVVEGSQLEGGNPHQAMLDSWHNTPVLSGLLW